MFRFPVGALFTDLSLFQTISRQVGVTPSLLLVFLWAGALFAAEDESRTKDTAEPPTVNEQVTVTAERRAVPVKDTPAFVTVLDDQTLGERLVGDIRQAVRYVPGVSVERDLTRLGLNGFTIRGIGGNRVMTQVDGVPASEQFDFGPLSAHQLAIDVDTLKALEIVRGAASSLYGSDALGGVVSFVTKDPADYLNDWGRDRGVQFKTGYDTARDESQLALTTAARRGNLALSLTASSRDFAARDNQGEVDSLDITRTRPNDVDGTSLQLLAKAVWQASADHRWRLTVENNRAKADTAIYSSQGLVTSLGPPTQVSDATADDRQDRLRLSLDHQWTPMGGLADRIAWQVHWQATAAEQDTSEQRSVPGINPIQRLARFTFDQDDVGIDVQADKLLTGTHGSLEMIYGAEWRDSQFEQLRDRRDVDLVTGNADAYRGPLVFPTRYFPNSTVRETGAFVQAKAQLLAERLTLIGGLRYDDYALDADQNDRVYLDSTDSNNLPVDSDSDAFSPKLGFVAEVMPWLHVTGHFARGFRAPVYSAINSGFTNLTSGYQSVPNPDLRPEESENLEFGIRLQSTRASLDITYFDNDFQDFIENNAFLGVSPTGILQFQAQNLGQVRIDGFEMRAHWQLTDFLRLHANYAHSDGHDQATNQPINSLEPDQGVLGLGYRCTRWGMELNGVFVAAKDATNINMSDDEPFAPDAYQLLDITAHAKLAHGFTVHLGGFNLTNETYFAWPDVRGRAANDPVIDRYSAPGRQFRLDLRYQF